MKKWRISQVRIFQFFFIALLAIAVNNTVVLWEELRRINGLKKAIAHQNIGYQFAGLEDVTKDVKYIGYFTDGDIKKKYYEKMLTQAQYRIAPTIIDYNNPNHEFMLLIYSNKALAQVKLREIGAEALLENQYGIIYARKNR